MNVSEEQFQSHCSVCVGEVKNINKSEDWIHGYILEVKWFRLDLKCSQFKEIGWAHVEPIVADGLEMKISEVSTEIS